MSPAADEQAESPVDPAFGSFPFSLAPAPGWTAEVRPESDGSGRYVAVVPLGGDALLRLTTFRPEDARMDAAHWVEFAAKVHPPRGRPVIPVRYGDFAGFETRYAVGDGRRLRGGVMHAGAVPLDFTYTCAEADAGRDDAAVEAMLRSLRLKLPAG